MEAHALHDNMLNITRTRFCPPLAEEFINSIQELYLNQFIVCTLIYLTQHVSKWPKLGKPFIRLGLELLKFNTTRLPDTNTTQINGYGSSNLIQL